MYTLWNGSALFLLRLAAAVSIFIGRSSAFDCHCPMLLQSECTNCTTKCIWNGTVSACRSSSFGGLYNYTAWSGVIEFGQTHVVKATDESRSAPKLIAEREAEMLFTPTQQSPTMAPTPAYTTQYGLEQLGVLDVALPSGTWPSGYPSDKTILLVPQTEYYIPNVRPDVNINFDLNSSRLVAGVYIQTWYVTTVNQIQIGLHSDDGYTGVQPKSGTIYLPSMSDPGWKWINGTAITDGYNTEQVISVSKLSARYVQIRLRGGSSSCSSEWGLRQVKISEAFVTPGTQDSFLFGYPIANAAYTPPSNANIRVAVYSSKGAILGVMDMRNPSQQRPLLEQSLISTTLSPYSSTAWSATLPWNWIREGVTLLIGTTFSNSSSNLVLKKLKLTKLAVWGQHTLSRTKIAVFGNSSDFAALDTTTNDASMLAKGMFNAMPTSELRWEDSVWHLPYLVVTTSKGPALVNSEAERRQVLSKAGDTPGTEPPWETLKEWGSMRHRMANSGMGLSHTTQDDCCGSIEYASGTSIFMGWALSSNATGRWNWDYLGYWDGWSAAAWVGWCGMVPGDECGNTLIHELGHSQTMSHWTTVQPESAVEYPLGGVNMPWGPWGYDTTSRRFRTWYTVSNTSVGKNDPMNGGEDSNKETCFPQYTAYHAQLSQNWSWSSPVLLAAGMGENVTAPGAYIYNASNQKYQQLNKDSIRNSVDDSAAPPLEVSVPVVTIIGTIGSNVAVCQMYPAHYGSAGNTFSLPGPLTPNLPSVFSGAAHYVKISFADGSSENALIAVPKTITSTELRQFSFTVAISRRPVNVSLYRYNTDAYPSLLSSSTATLLYSRSIDTSNSTLLKQLSGVVRVGRGWLGGSSKITIDSICTDDQDCMIRAVNMTWTGSEGGQMVYSVNNTSSSGASSTASFFNIKAVRQEDGLEYTVTISASRFNGENGASIPLLNLSSQTLAPDALFGARFSVPYELNKNLVVGSYSSLSTNGLLNGKLALSDGSVFANFDVAVKFKILAATAKVDLSNSKSYTSTETFYASASSAYFLASDSSIGPATAVWWGGSRDTLTIPMTSSCTSQKVTAVVKAQQVSCSSYWQMSAGRGADSCGHQLVLAADPYDLNLGQNTWIKSYPGCTFSTHPVRPVVISCFRWHDPEGGKILGTLVYDVTFTTPSQPTKPVKPIVTPATPALKPLQPWLLPTKPISKPLQPIPTITVPILKPTGPLVTPALKPSQPWLLPSKPNLKPVQPIVGPLMLPTKPVKPIQPILIPVTPVKSPSNPSRPTGDKSPLLSPSNTFPAKPAAMAQDTQNCSVAEFSSLKDWVVNLRVNSQQALLPRISTTCPTTSSKRKVLLIGVDGLRADAAAMLPLPNIHRLQQLGSWTFWANVQSTGSAVSGPGWASLLTGVEPTKHKVDSNADMRDIAYPTVLKTVKDILGKKVAASCTWAPLIDDFISYTDPSTLDAFYKASNDEAMTNAAVNYINNGTYDFIFVDFDECDAAGHSYGFDGYNPSYQAAVIKTDERIGLLLNAIFARSGEEWLIVLTSDHGGKGTSHGDVNMENRRIPFMVASNSPRVRIGPAPEADPGSHMDVLPTIHWFFNISIPAGLDGQVFGFLDYVRTPPSQCVSDPLNCGCGQQTEYRGTIAATVSGKTCQAWSSQSPQSHDRTSANYPNAGLESNYCRNPDGEARAWCYTMDPNTRWELCNVPLCGSSPLPAPISPSVPAPVAEFAPASAPTACPASNPLTCGCSNMNQADYRGYKNTTVSGKTCQAWTSQSPQQHTRTPSNYPNAGLVSNYCRNPDGESGAWCYTTDVNKRWELCGIPNC